MVQFWCLQKKIKLKKWIIRGICDKTFTAVIDKQVCLSLPHICSAYPYRGWSLSTLYGPYHGFNELECYIRLGWKGLPRTNNLAYWALSYVTKKMKCCEYNTCPLKLYLNGTARFKNVTIVWIQTFTLTWTHLVVIVNLHLNVVQFFNISVNSTSVVA